MRFFLGGPPCIIYGNMANVLLIVDRAKQSISTPLLTLAPSMLEAAENSGGLKGPEGETRIQVEGRVLLGGESSQKL